MNNRSTTVTCHIKAPRSKVYRALIDEHAIAHWKVPHGMTLQVHEFDGREGGAFRISLTYEAPDATGKTAAHTDTYHGRYVELVPDVKVVEQDEFETSNPAFQGVMTITITLADSDGGTEVIALHEGLPEGVTASDNELGWRMSLQKLAEFVEGDHLLSD